MVRKPLGFSLEKAVFVRVARAKIDDDQPAGLSSQLLRKLRHHPLNMWAERDGASRKLVRSVVGQEGN
ncbi:MAG TPA: hypothetical protein PK819_10660, partial [Thermomicrobiales bacterium]|nr:hypothetical protein [Thermomicrobiales bacterium]